mmetsp:Transcript_13784/g.30962  ORF Transcript_13784/g.30962 Transcript_13784/m.30962 type:complete len:116 (+) Transcript_13784:346-693(+)
MCSTRSRPTILRSLFSTNSSRLWRRPSPLRRSQCRLRRCRLRIRTCNPLSMPTHLRFRHSSSRGSSSVVQAYGAAPYGYDQQQQQPPQQPQQALQQPEAPPEAEKKKKTKKRGCC